MSGDMLFKVVISRPTTKLNAKLLFNNCLNLCFENGVYVMEGDGVACVGEENGG